MHVHEQTRKARCEIGQKAFGHLAQPCFERRWQFLVVVFLTVSTVGISPRRRSQEEKKSMPDLISKCAQKIYHTGKVVPASEKAMSARSLTQSEHNSQQCVIVTEDPG